ncbi:universal stress protein [Aureimonas sp. SA4125]|uniref:universal stress protein n=1 Tax=Aureimonas sp. SA4125 TaxID=2826993 RepID=UPI001CC35680|nr:universal stress protein [Aureimonas sp. SA4125]BDA86722.1 universal stress protein [Aureimonas sp. SA4125]
MYKNILIATDGSVLSQKGVEQGLALAHLCGAKVTVLTVSEPFPTFDLVSKLSFFQDPEVVSRYAADCKVLADKTLAAAETVAATVGVACETLYVDNTAPAAAILEAAKLRGCGLIVVTSHGRRGLERMVIGSQATKVLTQATVPVLVVR